MQERDCLYYQKSKGHYCKLNTFEHVFNPIPGIVIVRENGWTAIGKPDVMIWDMIYFGRLMLNLDKLATAVCKLMEDYPNLYVSLYKGDAKPFIDKLKELFTRLERTPRQEVKTSSFTDYCTQTAYAKIKGKYKQVGFVDGYTGFKYTGIYSVTLAPGFTAHQGVTYIGFLSTAYPIEFYAGGHSSIYELRSIKKFVEARLLKVKVPCSAFDIALAILYGIADQEAGRFSKCMKI